MDITCRNHGGFTVLDLAGRWPIGPREADARDLRSVVDRLAAAGQVRLAFNLRGVEALDAHGLGELARTHALLREVGGGLTLVAPNARVRTLLAVTRLDSVMRVCGREGELQRGSRTEVRPASSPARAGPAPC